MLIIHTIHTMLIHTFFYCTQKSIIFLLNSCEKKIKLITTCISFIIINIKKNDSYKKY